MDQNEKWIKVKINMLKEQLENMIEISHDEMKAICE